MYLQDKVSSLIHSNNLNMYDLDGKRVEPSHVKKEYHQIKNYLLLNFKSDDIISIKLRKDYKYLLVMLACIEIGLTYIPMKDTFPQERIKQILALADVEAIIDEEALSLIFSSDEVATISSFEIYPSKPLYIIFTSGSTGEPKGVVIKRESCENFFVWVDQYFSKLDHNIKLLQVADFSFDMSVLDIGVLLTKQVHMFFTTFDGNVFRMAYEIENFQISLISTVPNNFNMLLSEGVKERVNLESLKTIFIGGARFSFGLYKKMIDYFDKNETQIYNFYGPTEATVYATVYQLTYDEKKDTIDHNISVGFPLLNTTIMILNDNKETISEGEMFIGGMQVMKEYISNTEKTQEVLIKTEEDIFYKTGDISFVDEEGKYYIIGRLDDTIKRKGYRINTLDIDSYIHKIEGVLDCVTISIPDELYENKIITYIITNESELTSIKSKMTEILADYQIPDKINIIDELPLNNSGKVCKKILTQMYLEK